MFKQFLKNWDDTFHEVLEENQNIRFSRGKSSTSGSSLITLDDINMLRKIKNGSKSQSYMEINNDFQEHETQIDTLKSSVDQFTFVRQSNTFTRRLGKNWKMQSQIGTKDKPKPKTNTAKFPTFKCFLMNRYNSQNV